MANVSFIPISNPRQLLTHHQHLPLRRPRHRRHRPLRLLETRKRRRNRPLPHRPPARPGHRASSRKQHRYRVPRIQLEPSYRGLPRPKDIPLVRAVSAPQRRGSSDERLRSSYSQWTGDG